MQIVERKRSSIEKQHFYTTAAKKIHELMRSSPLIKRKGVFYKSVSSGYFVSGKFSPNMRFRYCTELSGLFLP